MLRSNLSLIVAFAAIAGCTQAAATIELRPEYTRIGLQDCFRPAEAVLRAYDKAGLTVEQCPAPAGVALYVVSADPRSWLEVGWNGTLWSSERLVVYGAETNAVGNFPNVGGSAVVEWRMSPANEPVGLIFRIAMQDREGDPNMGDAVSRLAVLGFRGGSVCWLGLTTTNERARQIADDPSIACEAPLAKRAID